MRSLLLVLALVGAIQSSVNAQYKDAGNGHTYWGIGETERTKARDQTEGLRVSCFAAFEEAEIQYSGANTKLGAGGANAQGKIIAARNAVETAWVPLFMSESRQTELLAQLDALESDRAGTRAAFLAENLLDTTDYFSGVYFQELGLTFTSEQQQAAYNAWDTACAFFYGARIHAQSLGELYSSYHSQGIAIINSAEAIRIEGLAAR